MVVKFKNCRVEIVVKVMSCGLLYIKVCVLVKNWVVSLEMFGLIEEYDCYYDNGNLVIVVKLYFREGGLVYIYLVEKIID